MTYNQILLALAALLPAIALCIYVYIKDRAEKEPVLLLLLLFILGGLTTLPGGFLEGLFMDPLESMFSAHGYSVGDVTYLSPFAYRVYNFLLFFMIVAIVEEGVKWLVLFFVTRKNKNFNSIFDGLIYSVFVSLGFAALENIKYTFNFGFSAALIRAFTAVPGHMFFSVFMGLNYSYWWACRQAAKVEGTLVESGDLRKPCGRIPAKRYLVLSYVLPVLFHGIYDYLCNMSSSAKIYDVFFYIFLAILYFRCFKKIRDLSATDGSKAFTRKDNPFTRPEMTGIMFLTRYNPEFKRLVLTTVTHDPAEEASNNNYGTDYQP